MATVSRTLNSPASVSEKTKILVMEAVEKLKYSPNYLGKNLRQQSTGRVLVILDTISNQFYSRVVHGIEDIARNENYHVLIFATRNMKSNLSEAISMIKNRTVDGAIFLTTQESVREISEIYDSYPVVCACDPVADSAIACVSIDNVRASCDAVNYLIRTGKRRIAMLGAKKETADSVCAGNYRGSAILRERGYCKALTESGINPDPQLMIREGFSFNAGIRGAKRILKLEQLPDAVFAISDACAVGAIHTFAENGVRVPEDISVIGFDNTAISEMYSPAITTVAQPQYQIGTLAMQLLLKRMEGGQISDITVEHELIIRNSVADS